jgi:nicotinamide mononucleotide transporter
MFDWVNLETVAVALSIAYLILAMKENSLCWYCAFVSTAIYVVIFGDVSLYMESALNGYYMAMAIYGWYQWQRGGSANQGVALSIGLILLLTVISGYLLTVTTEARLPYIDSFTTWASVVTTVMVARKVLENWLYWIVINSVSIFLYIDRELYQTAAMFVVYLVLAIIGYFTWRKNYLEQDSYTAQANSS